MIFDYKKSIQLPIGKTTVLALGNPLWHIDSTIYIATRAPYSALNIPISARVLHFLWDTHVNTCWSVNWFSDGQFHFRRTVPIHFMLVSWATVTISATEVAFSTVSTTVVPTVFAIDNVPPTITVWVCWELKVSNVCVISTSFKWIWSLYMVSNKTHCELSFKISWLLFWNYFEAMDKQACSQTY